MTCCRCMKSAANVIPSTGSQSRHRGRHSARSSPKIAQDSFSALSGSRGGRDKPVPKFARRHSVMRAKYSCEMRLTLKTVADGNTAHGDPRAQRIREDHGGPLHSALFDVLAHCVRAAFEQGMHISIGDAKRGGDG